MLPLLIPLTTAAVSLLAWRRALVQRVLAVAGAAALLGAGAGAARLRLARRHLRDPGRGLARARSASPWSPTCSARSWWSWPAWSAWPSSSSRSASMDRRREAFGYYPLVHALLMGVCGAFLTGDLFNLYVWFEVMLMASFVLLVLGGERPQLHGRHQVRHPEPGVVGPVPGRASASSTA